MIRYEEYIKKLMDDFADESLIYPDAFPTMGLYSDQVTSFINDELEIYEDKEPVLTKTMIGNYVKRNMIPKPDKKKYSRDHIIMLATILYLKSVFQISEIESLMKPFVDNHNSTFEDQMDLFDIYKSVSSHFREERAEMTQSIVQDIDEIKEAIRDKGLDDDDNTEIFLVIMNLAMKADAAKYAANALYKEYISSDKNK